MKNGEESKEKICPACGSTEKQMRKGYNPFGNTAVFVRRVRKDVHNQPEAESVF